MLAAREEQVVLEGERMVLPLREQRVPLLWAVLEEQAVQEVFSKSTLPIRTRARVSCVVTRLVFNVMCAEPL